MDQDLGWSATYNSIATGIAENNISNAIKLFPVPVKDVLNITLLEAITGTLKIQIYDITGQKVLSETWNPKGNTSIKVDVTLLRTGAYIVELNSEKFNIHKKLIKQ